MTQLGPGQIDIISINMFLHLFNWQNQLRAATRILRLLSHNPGSLILGSQAGSVNAGELPLKPPFAHVGDGEERTVFRHNPGSFEQLWLVAGKAVGVPLRVSVVFQAPDAFGKGVDFEKKFFTGPDTRRLYFSIMRVNEKSSEAL